MIRYSFVNTSRNPKYPSNDAVSILDIGNQAILLTIADGVGRGRDAAVAFIEAVKSTFHLDEPLSDEGLIELIYKGEVAVIESTCDGETTGIVVVIENSGDVKGVSAGDSEAWFISKNGEIVKITSRQIRKPRIGAGCKPVPCQEVNLSDGILLVATDHLFNEISERDIQKLAISTNPEFLPSKLLEQVTTKQSGKLGDDFTCAVVWRQN